jgi:hypothetical protein
VIARGDILAERISRDTGHLTEAVGGRLEEMDRLITDRPAARRGGVGKRLAGAHQGVVDPGALARDRHDDAALQDVIARGDILAERISRDTGHLTEAVGGRLEAVSASLVRTRASLTRAPWLATATTMSRPTVASCIRSRT